MKSLIGKNLNQSSSNSKTNNEIIIPEIVTMMIYIVFTIFMFSVHELNHEEIQLYLLAKDSEFINLFGELPHYMETSPLFMLILWMFSKMGLPMVIALRATAFPLSALGAYFIIFKAPFKKWIRCLIPFSFFLFYEYTVICTYTSILFGAVVVVAMLYRKRMSSPVLYLLGLILLSNGGYFGAVFSTLLAVIWGVEIVIPYIKREMIGLPKDIKIWCSFGALSVNGIYFLMSIPRNDSFYMIFVDRAFSVRNIIYTFFIMPGDSMLTDVDFYGLLQNNSWRFMRLTPVIISAFFVSVALWFLGYMMAYVYKKRRVLLVYPSLALFGGFGILYHYHVGMVVLFLVFLIWVCLDDPGQRRDFPKWIQLIDNKYNMISVKIAFFMLILCLGMSLVWAGFSCYNDVINEVSYAKQLNAIIEKWDLEGYDICSDWKNAPIIDDISQNALFGSAISPTDFSEEEEENRNRNGNVEEGYVITYLVKQLSPKDFYMAPNSLNYADAVAYSKNQHNYIDNLNQGNKDKRYIDYHFLNRADAEEYCIEYGGKGYPDIIIGDPNIVGLMGLDAENVRYYLIYEIRIRRSYKLYSVYESSQMFIRSDLYFDKNRWPFMEQW